MTTAQTAGRLALQEELDRALEWLFDVALPFWFTKGVDFSNGGFFERYTPQGELLDDPRRTRLVGRQVYAFATADRLGWQGDGHAAMRHGLQFLLEKSLSSKGGVHSSVDPSGRVIASDFDLYDHAFALFGLAAAASQGEDTSETAHRLLDHIRSGWQHPVAGFEEASPRSLPLKANPHMHLLEASLAWAELEPEGVWGELADEIVELCLGVFLSPDTGALHEFFDGDWQVMTSPPLDVVEPGHQYEWSWLLVRWGLLRNRRDAILAANTLHRLAESCGVDQKRNLAINELNADLTTRDGLARLWPQTERVKSTIAQARLQIEANQRDAAERMAAVALSNLKLYYAHPVPGLWWEHLDSQGVPLSEPSRASSLYHVICAVAEVAAYLTEPPGRGGDAVSHGTG